MFSSQRCGQTPSDVVGSNLMETIPTSTLLDRGAQYLGNHPDHLARRIVLAQVLVDNRAVKSVEAGVVAFRIWATPGSQDHPVEILLDLANKKTKE